MLRKIVKFYLLALGVWGISSAEQHCFVIFPSRGKGEALQRFIQDREKYNGYSLPWAREHRLYNQSDHFQDTSVTLDDPFTMQIYGITTDSDTKPVVPTPFKITRSYQAKIQPPWKKFVPWCKKITFFTRFIRNCTNFSTISLTKSWKAYFFSGFRREK